MSLLLDALKKAAEQKAQKGREEDLGQRASDETLLEAAADVANGNGDDAVSVQANDETEFEHTDIRARLERGERIAGDDTGLDITDYTDSVRVSEQPMSGRGEETGLDYPDPTRTGFDGDQPEGPAASDETGLELSDSTRTELEVEKSGQPTTGDETGLDLKEPEQSDPPSPPQQAREDTGLDIPEEQQTADGRELPFAPTGDDTGLEILADEEISVIDSEIQTLTDEDETVVAPDEEANDSSDSEPVADQALQADDDSELDLIARSVEPAELVDDKTDISMPLSSADQIETGSPELAPGPGDLELIEMQVDRPDDSKPFTDEDLSLLLIDPEPTGPGSSAAFTKAEVAVDRAATTTDSGVTGGEIELVDTSETRDPGNIARAEQTDTQGPTLTNTTATAIHADDTQSNTLAAPTRSTITRPADTTSTQTYAPDNYDRTLMKLPSDDSSKLFAGMKPEADVVMTPDYAKKVFRSKTSAQRVHHYKYYAGISFALLLAIVIYGGIEYQNESEQIDARLRPLKYDPMPGKIKIPQSEETRLFDNTDGQVDARTIEIIETATTEASAGDEVVAIIDPAAEQVAVTEGAVVDSGEAEADGERVQAEVAQAEVAEVEIAKTEVEMSAEPITTVAVATTVTSSSQQTQSLEAPSDMAFDAASDQQQVSTNAESSNSSLQIETSNEYRKADLWLQEAYQAYRDGNLEQAMAGYNRVLDANPSNRNALLGRAAISIQQDAIDAAIRDYRQLLLANPKDSLAMSSLLSVGSYSPGETESQLKLMIREEPESPYLNFALANAYGAQDRWQEAQGHYFTALQNNPGDPNYAYNLAVSLEHISQPASAIAYYQRALENMNNGPATFSREVVSQRLQVLEKL